jgi:hypothetical protein
MKPKWRIGETEVKLQALQSSVLYQGWKWLSELGRCIRSVKNSGCPSTTNIYLKEITVMWTREFVPASSTTGKDSYDVFNASEIASSI